MGGHFYCTLVAIFQVIDQVVCLPPERAANILNHIFRHFSLQAANADRIVALKQPSVSRDIESASLYEIQMFHQNLYNRYIEQQE